MDSNFIKATKEEFTNLVIAANNVNIQRAKFGFVNSDCDFIKSMLSTICIHVIENPIIFNDAQSANIIHIINKLSYGK